MTQYNLVAENDESTVLSYFEGSSVAAETTYQSEAELEQAFIRQLQQQQYEYLPIHEEKDLVDNLRLQLERLNDYNFTDEEWERFFRNCIARPKDGIEEKSFVIQEDHIQVLERDGGLPPKNIYLIDKTHIHRNHLQVINQYEENRGKYHNRYDVSILVNGLPLVHVELKRRGVSIKEAFNQINRYQRDSFWAGSGLYEYIQLFVISNGTETKYYSNTTRNAHIKEMAGQEKKGQQRKTSNSFEFTSFWADATNRPILDLMDFTGTFFSKHVILKVLTKYCILTTDRILMVMRPYQIVAVEQILNRIMRATYAKTYGTINAGGYVWHTTGSGKTLTSFKTAQMASKLEYVNKVLFVVDRKDLDYQTMKEYDKFEKGAANSNTSTAILQRQLQDPDCRIIITTIQKLASLIKKNKEFEAYQKNIVFIFDECHRSQFGDMHTAIIKKFKRYYIFGFTGTPIFPQNSSSSGKPNLKTTEQAFGDKLHTYTIVDAIADQNVLPFRVEYISTIKSRENIKDEDVWNIDREKALLAPRRIRRVSEYILEHFNQKTKRNDKSYIFRKLLNIEDVAAAKRGKEAEEQKQSIRMTGFNSIFAVASIPAARLYYNELKRLMSERPEAERLKIATIFSFGVNDDEEENSESTDGLEGPDRDFLESAIKDYNQMFQTNYDTSSEKFQNYYKDVSLRMKNREIDLLIVVNMFLTGFDATTLNTLWVDKNLRMHGLLQAFSRTNRILNAIKNFGNIVCFRNLEKATNDAISLFGDKDACGIVLMKTFEEYFNGYDDEKGKHIKGYRDLVQELLERFPIGERIDSEEEQKRFIKLFGALLKLRNVLSVFDKFAETDLLTERDLQDYSGMYNDLYDQYRRRDHHESADVQDDIEFEMELIKQIEINIDYILALVKKYHEEHTVDGQIEVRTNIDRAINSSLQLRKKKELIEAFINSLTPTSNIDDDWNTFVRKQMLTELDDIIQTERLKDEPARQFVRNCFNNGYVETSGTDIAGILPPMGRFSASGNREEKKLTVIEKIKSFFEKFFDICPRGLEEINE